MKIYKILLLCCVFFFNSYGVDLGKFVKLVKRDYRELIGLCNDEEKTGIFIREYLALDDEIKNFSYYIELHDNIRGNPVNAKLNISTNDILRKTPASIYENGRLRDDTEYALAKIFRQNTPNYNKLSLAMYIGSFRRDYVMGYVEDLYNRKELSIYLALSALFKMTSKEIKTAIKEFNPMRIEFLNAIKAVIKERKLDIEIPDSVVKNSQALDQVTSNLIFILKQMDEKDKLLINNDLFRSFRRNLYNVFFDNKIDFREEFANKLLNANILELFFLEGTNHISVANVSFVRSYLQLLFGNADHISELGFDLIRHPAVVDMMKKDQRFVEFVFDQMEIFKDIK